MNHLQLVASTAATTDVPARPASPTYVRRRVQNGLILAFGDVTTLLLASTVGISFEWMTNGVPVIPVWTWAFPVGWILGAQVAGLYPGWAMGRLEEIRRMLRVFAVVAPLSAVASLLAAEQLTVPFYLACGTALVMLPPLHVRTRRSLQRTDDWGVPVVIYGAGDVGARTIRHLRHEAGLGFDPVAVVDDNPARQGRVVEELHVLGRAGDRVPATDTAIVAMAESERRRALVDRLTGHYENVILMSAPLDRARTVGHASDFDGLLAVVLTSKLYSRTARSTKRGIELLVVLVTVPIWVPLLGAISLAVWLEDRHTPFARQVRIARDGTPFSMLRFRIVVPNTAETLRNCLQEDAALRREWETRFRLVDDPRVTRLGGMLRRLGLDGLPQIIHVLRGQMALVGPQPLPPYRYAQQARTDGGPLRIAAPGMTGLWKVYGDREDAASDTYYVRRWSIGLDLAILMQSWIELVAPEKC